MEKAKRLPIFLLDIYHTPLIFMSFLRFVKVRKRTKIRNRYNQAPHLTQDTNGKVTTSQLDITNECHEVSPFPTGDHKASKTDVHERKTKQDRNNISVPQKKPHMERPVKIFTGGLKPV